MNTVSEYMNTVSALNSRPRSHAKFALLIIVVKFWVSAPQEALKFTKFVNLINFVKFIKPNLLKCRRKLYKIFSLYKCLYMYKRLYMYKL